MLGLVAVAARPDKNETVGLGLDQRREDRSREARVIELDREIVTAFVGALGPGGPDLGFMPCTA